MITKCYAIIEDKNHKILLKKRNAIQWTLPGGIKKEGEALEACMIRSIKEETGLEIEIDYLIGEFQHTTTKEVQYVFACRQVGGCIDEKKLKYYSSSFLPMGTSCLCKKQIGCYRKGNINRKLKWKHPLHRINWNPLRSRIRCMTNLKKF